MSLGNREMLEILWKVKCLLFFWNKNLVAQTNFKWFKTQSKMLLFNKKDLQNLNNKPSNVVFTDLRMQLMVFDCEIYLGSPSTCSVKVFHPKISFFHLQAQTCFCEAAVCVKKMMQWCAHATAQQRARPQWAWLICGRRFRPKDDAIARPTARWRNGPLEWC